MKEKITEKITEKISPNIVFLNNTFIEKSEAKISAFDHGFLYGDGVYETLLLSNFEVQDFNSHYIRLKKSCKTMGIQLPQYIQSSEKTQKILKNLIKKNPEISQRGRLRITISRGENSFNFSGKNTATVLISLSPLPPYPEKIMKEGVSVKTLTLERSYPEIKSTNFLASLLGRREIALTGEYEGIFINTNGYIREGTVSNVIAINYPQKTFFLAPEKTVLAGTMQEKISRILSASGFTKHYRNFSIQNIQEEVLEVYITNSLFGIIPVKKIDTEFLSSYTKNTQKFLAFNTIMKNYEKF